MVMVPVLFFAALLGTGEARELADDSGSSQSGSSPSYSAPVRLAPEVICGCTDALKNFA